MPLGCQHCDWSEFTDPRIYVPLGYIVLQYWDEFGPYECLGRCYYCNHRDRT